MAPEVTYLAATGFRNDEPKDICIEVANLTPDEQEPPKEIEKSPISLPPKRTSLVGFAIDIDGVLIKDRNLLPGALDTIHRLHEMKAPFVLLTNRLYFSAESGVSELRGNLALPNLHPNQLVQRLTPFKFLLPRCSKKPVLVTSYCGTRNRTYRDLICLMGLENVYIPEDFYGASPELQPEGLSARDLLDSYVSERAQELRDCQSNEALKVDISAIFVFGGWASSRMQVENFERRLPHKLLIQILKSQSGDLREPAKSNGDPSLPNEGYQQSDAPMIYYEICQSEYSGWRSHLELAWKKETGRVLLHQHEICRKPTSSIFTYATRMLEREQRRLHGDNATGPEKIVMIGDCPWYDIRGPNWYKKKPGQSDVWKSALVKTGQWKVEISGFPTGLDKPDFLALDVKMAVEWGLKSFGWGDSGSWEILARKENSDNNGDTPSTQRTEDSGSDMSQEFSNHASDYEEYEEWDVTKHNKFNECYTYKRLGKS